MKLRKLTQMLILAGAMASFAAASVWAADDFGTELRGPGGARKPAPAAQDGVQRASSSVPERRRSGKPGNKPNTAAAKKDNAPKYKDPNAECQLKMEPDVAVPAPTIAVISDEELRAPKAVHEVGKGETFLGLERFVQNDDQTLSREQCLAALYRLNPKSFKGTGPMAGQSLKIPNEKLVRLEKTEDGKKVLEALKQGRLEKVKLSDLEKPWDKEQKEIAAKKEEKAIRDQKQAENQKQYETCVAHINAENERLRAAEEDRRRAPNEVADIGSPEMMIGDDSGQTYTGDGKRQITLVDEGRQQASQDSGSSVSGSTLTLTSGSAVGKNAQGTPVSSSMGASSEEFKKLEARVARLEEILDKERGDGAVRVQALQEELEALKTNQEVLMKRLEDLEKSTNEPGSGSDSENGLMIFIVTMMGLILLSGLGFGAYLRIKQNRKRKALLMEEDDNIMEGTDDLDVLDSLGGDQIDDISGSRQKEVSLSPAEPAPKPAPETPPPPPPPAGDLDDLDEESFRQSIRVPDLEKPDEGISDVSSSPDLVPPRPSHEVSRKEPPKPAPKPAPEPDPKEQEAAAQAMGIDLSAEGDVHDAVMDEWAKALGEQKKAEEAPKSDEDVMSEWAKALGEEKAEQKEEAGKPKSDADVMSEWAQALGEEKAEQKKEAGKPKSDADVMDEWAKALGEQKEEENKPKSDADVMDEWAKALGEQKEEENKPKSDADVMDEWAKALGEQKEEENKPKSDDDVLDEWAKALGEQKAEENKAKSDDEVLDEWAKALGEQKAEENKPKSDDEVLDEWAKALGEQKKS